jgi:hypothetical protein
MSAARAGADTLNAIKPTVLSKTFFIAFPSCTVVYDTKHDFKRILNPGGGNPRAKMATHNRNRNGYGKY